MALLASYGVHLFLRRNAGQLNENGDHHFACKIAQRICKVAVCVLFKVAQEPRVELFLVERGLEVYAQPVFRLAEIAHMRACR